MRYGRRQWLKRNTPKAAKATITKAKSTGSSTTAASMTGDIPDGPHPELARSRFILKVELIRVGERVVQPSGKAQPSLYASEPVELPAGLGGTSHQDVVILAVELVDKMFDFRRAVEL